MAAAQLRRVAAEAGIGPTDPLGPVVLALADTAESVANLPDACAERFETLDARLSALLNKAETSATGNVARLAAAELPGAVDRLVLQRTWWMCLIFVVVFIGTVYGALRLGDYERGEELIQVQAGLNSVLKGSDAQQWLKLIQLNRQDGALRNCTPQPQPTGGEACSFTLWTKLPNTQ